MCIKEFDSFVGDAGDLPCHGIIHIVLPKFSSDSAESDIAHAVRQCLVQADKEHATSITFPMIGTGRFGYPDQIIVECMIAAMKRYLVENGTNSFLRHITICDIEKDLSILLPETVRKDDSHTTGNVVFKMFISLICCEFYSPITFFIYHLQLFTFYIYNFEVMQSINNENFNTSVIIKTYNKYSYLC